MRCSSRSSTRSLHPLKGWSLRKTRAGSSSVDAATVKFFTLDGKTGRDLNALGWGKGEYDNTCFDVFRDLSGSIALQRSFSTVCLTVSLHRDELNTRRNKRLAA